MTTELITSLIALAGIVISILASSLVNSRQIKIEIKKLRTELQLAYAGKLIEKRMETYPVFYKLISTFQKRIHSGDFTKQEFDKFFKAMLEWDSSNAIFMSGHAVNTYAKFRAFMRTIIRMSKLQFIETYKVEETKRALINEIRKLEIVLKQDLGVYLLEFPDVDKTITSYSDIEELSKKYKS